MGQSDTALLILDYQTGVGNLSYAQDAASRAAIALEAGRKARLCIVFVKSCLGLDTWIYLHRTDHFKR